MKSRKKENAEGTELMFKGIEYAFILKNEDVLVRRLDNKIPNEYELVSVIQYIQKEFLVDVKSF